MRLIKTIIALLIASVTYSQVGIETTTPTNTLDVNGGVRVRELQEGTVQSDPLGNLGYAPYKVYAFVVVDKPGTVLKQYGVSSVQNLGSGKYRINFTNAMADNDYIILAMAKNRNITYDTVTPNSVEVTVSSTSNHFDFNVIIIDII